MRNIDRLRIAYKKLKATVFFDKTQLPLRDQLVLYEDNIEEKLSALEQALFHGVGWDEAEKTILDSIGVLIYPKRLKTVDDDMAIFNSDSIAIEMDEPQYFIDLSPAGQLLGVLWVLEIGAMLDKNAGEECDKGKGMYPYSYGNRLRKNLINRKTNNYTYAPGLFEPYFSQYQSWRDHALDYAKERLNDKQDAFILTLDFKSFFYSVDIQQPMFDGFVERADKMPEKHRHIDWLKRLNLFVYRVIERYSQKLRSIHIDNDSLSLKKRNVLPIGFFPSNILSNVVLTPFDNEVIKKWNPVYYGRYVDDIIIVDKVETNSEIFRLARSADKKDRLDSDWIINQFLCESGIMKSDKVQTDNNDQAGKKSDDNDDLKPPVTYHILPWVLSCGDSFISVQDRKVRLFYFQSGATKALLNCFHSKIQENVSEFRLLPDMDAVIKYGDYSELFQIKSEDSINKLRSVTGINLDKFALAKFLGKYRKVGAMIQSKEEDAFAEDAILIFDERFLVENYNAWERLFEIFVVNQRLDIVEKLAMRIISAIRRYEIPEQMHRERTAAYSTLLRTFHSALCRTLALVWGKNTEKLISSLGKGIQKIAEEDSLISDNVFSFVPTSMNLSRRAYCRTRMVNKYIIPLPIDCVLDHVSLSDKHTLNLCSLEDAKQVTGIDWYKKEDTYCYYPYMFLPQDISMAITYAEISSGENLQSPHKLVKDVKKAFMRLNYPIADDEGEVYDLSNIKSGEIEGLPGEGSRTACFATYVDTGTTRKNNKLRVAVGNAALKEADVRGALDLRPERGYVRYSNLRSMIDEAIREHVDLLVLPESYIPFEWIPTVSRVCANNQLALVTGVEHFVTTKTEDSDKKGTVYNLTAVILPYKRDTYNFAHIAFHNKVEYSPQERAIIEGYRYDYHKGRSHQIFCWNDVWFPVYCCYELTSIHDRALFQTYADMVVAVEWNPDIHYFGSIMDSLARDLHCYCIQANSSDYGDSRVMQPADSVHKDIIKTKGGKNTCILYDDIDIKALRDFQIKSLALQKEDGPFKQTPPDLDQKILEKKRNGTLKEVIQEAR